MIENQSIVYITGAGPGDPDLLTLKAKEVLEKTDVIAYDNLVSNEVLELALFLNPNVKLIYAGRVGYDEGKSVSVDKVCNLLIELAKEYKVICRLKGGDPNVFGRLGEEAVFLKQKGINFEIVPGISSVTAVPAYSGIPLTHRDFASSFTVLTASGDPDDPENKIKWENFDALSGTLVLLMGTRNLPKVANKLIELGRKKETPIAIIERGTTSEQKTYVSTLGELLSDLTQIEIKTPSLTIIGEVVKLREVLNWFETKPLFGKRILITRSKEQSISFASKLIKCSAKPISCPIVNYKINEKEIYNKNIVHNLSTYDWIFFTSQNGVKFFFEILSKNYLDSRALSNVKVAVVGYKTKVELEKYNVRADFVPKRFSFEDLVSELNQIEDLINKKILLPTQVETLHATSLQGLEKWPIYEANFIEKLDERIVEQIKGGIDIITFFSANTAKQFAKLVSKYNLNLVGVHHGAPLIATIGRETSNVVRELFGKVDIIADPFTEEGLIASMEKFYVRAGLAPALTGR